MPSMQEEKASHLALNGHKCDLKQDSCGQCIRAGLKCSGYRNPDELRIRDETNLVKEKALVSKAETIARFGDISIEEKSRGAFFSHYVHGIAKTYDVIEILHKTAPLDTHLDISITAVSLAFFHFRFFSPTASNLAGKTYLSALKLVNTALQNPTTLPSDSTLLAVLLLDLFEKITNNNPISSVSWISHVNGALALIKLRDSIQFQRYIGRRLSFRLTTCLVISCVAANARVPRALKNLRAEIENILHAEDPKWNLTDWIIKTTDFRGAIRNGSLSDVDIVLQAKQLDNGLSSLSATMPTAWLSQRKYIQQPCKKVFGQFYDQYPDYHVTQTHNVIRLTRIMLNDTIRTTYKEDSFDWNTTAVEPISLSFINSIIDDLAKEICSSGPQFIGFEDSPTPREAVPPSHQFFCYTLLFPFYVAALYASPGSMIKNWVTSQMYYMSCELGIRNAGTVAHILEKGDRMDPWSVYAILGSYAFAA
ncbi:uncharacterized protein A1O9_07796 [Exophiala aquamarina CBS 119918]|uniref:Zn(2)-C6 fungal-type domain-containing protein n=1 Tax=Exophiala aquamarina CBS 119918 TaxID=1182545 RepID=A0A072PL31_9EURO|nr:uncharacterized protein A1O9_07796 [Exophiala aquamarina CBS 119918]KEF56215.1 hypothetical protein A1O9_07796 [Exophiala aquamarina CBS 119918]